MTKRIGGFGEVHSKKLKVDENLDDLWGDDPNIEDCLIQATQVCEQSGLNSINECNNSIIPSYSFFEENNKIICTSTQKDSFHVNGNINLSSSIVYNSSNCGTKVATHIGNKYSKTNENDLNELQIQIKRLKDQCQYKEGEVSNLRIQLKETKLNLEAEHQKKEEDWAEKFSILNKEINSVKSQLEFKNLEVANLKNKILEISKAYTTDNFLNSSNYFTTEKKDEYINPFYIRNYKLEPILDTKYPLISKISSIYYHTKQSENFIIYFKSNHLRDFLNDDLDNEIFSKYKTIVECKQYKMHNIFPDISALIKSSSLDINSQLYNSHIDQIVNVLKHILSSLHSYLFLLESDMQHGKDIFLRKPCGTANLNLSVIDPRAWCDKEVGIEARQMIGLIAEIFPYSSYLREVLLTSFNHEWQNGTGTLENYLGLMNVIITSIGSSRKAGICEGFLCAVATLLLSISQTKEFSQSCSFISNISKEIIFTRPSAIVLSTLLLFFKQASLEPDFIKELCKISKSSLNTDNKREQVTLSRDSCQLGVFIALYNYTFIETGSINTVGLNTLEFITNLLNSNPSWLHCEENNRCDCLCKVIILGINVIHKLVKGYKKERHKIINKEGSKEYNGIFKYCIKILHIINFKYFDIINKYPVDSKYKFVISFLHTLKDDLELTESEYEALCELNIEEDMQLIKSTHFNQIQIWK